MRPQYGQNQPVDGVLVHEEAEPLAKGARATRLSTVETAATEKGLPAAAKAGENDKDTIRVDERCSGCLTFANKLQPLLST